MQQLNGRPGARRLALPRARPRRRPRPQGALLLLWRVAAVFFLAFSSVSAAFQAASSVEGGLGGPGAALGTDAVVLGAAAVVVAVTARREARLGVAVVAAVQLAAVATAREAGGLSLVGPGDNGEQVIRLLCGGAAAVVSLALLAWLDGREKGASGQGA
ncbi:hypothetical protein [Streptacidiphilus melanogenes]|uniref:hypothetical protein n=1 Tax=Streptacidiphilus melanogenes TaxID=411235 RepID=UPI0005A75E3F|nr:hypothetical protein [Streptacidiphilus melanogenes]